VQQENFDQNLQVWGARPPGFDPSRNPLFQRGDRVFFEARTWTVRTVWYPMAEEYPFRYDLLSDATFRERILEGEIESASLWDSEDI